MYGYINTTMKKIWKKMKSKPYRDSFVAAHISNTIAAQISSMREAAELTQAALARKLGTGQSRISALEDPNNTNVEIATLRRVASVFDVGLMIRFVPFSELSRWSGQLSAEDFAVPRFDEDSLDESFSVGEGQTVYAFQPSGDWVVTSWASVRSPLDILPIVETTSVYRVALASGSSSEVRENPVGH